jgi:arylsulfatase A-like enzyme
MVYYSKWIFACILLASFRLCAQEKPNIILIYTDDLGYGDLSCYGAKAVNTPNIDRLAQEGLLFRNAYATSATCTPSRYSLLTGQYAWRRKDTGIAPGNASLLIDPKSITLPLALKRAGYETAIVGKWHLGLGGKEGPQWNQEIKPGPLELGFNSSFIIPATVDRVPCVFVEGHGVVNYDPTDPIMVNYETKIGREPTGKENPALLKIKPSHGHNQTIVNGISRIGYMQGGKDALWKDEDIADILTTRALNYIEANARKKFFLYFSTHDIHVPRVPHQRFSGKSSMGPRGDVILQLDWCVGKILKTLDSLKIRNNTMIIFSSDNGPVVDDGYEDEAVEKIGMHKPTGQLRGGKYSAFEGGARVPFMVSWPGKIKTGVSQALFSQIDLLATLSSIVGYKLQPNEATDSFDALDVLLGKTNKDRAFVVEHALNGTLSIVQGNLKYIENNDGPKMSSEVNIELGNDHEPQLYDLKSDPGETKNIASLHPDKIKNLTALLRDVRTAKLIAR